MLEVTVRPVLMGQPPTVGGQAWLLELRGSDLFMYTTETLVSLPTSVSIANGVATLITGTRREHWRFTAEGMGAIKTPGP